jgi:phosphoglycerate dehydrogenase-like enzyme
LNELRLGILGLGRIGRRVAEVARAIGIDVSYADIREIPEPERAGATRVSTEELFASSDVLSLHIDGRPSNRNYVGAALLNAMPANSLLLNTCRGMVLDSNALAAVLRAHPQRHAVLDVHEPEPFGADYPLLGLPNARLLPHLASRTTSAVESMSWVVKDVVAVLEGREPQWSA